jgi:hypothetical protein
VTSTATGGALRRLAGALVIVVGVGAVLSACGTSGTGLAQQACGHINKSISLLHEAEHEADPQLASDFRQKAYVQLRKALPIAAEAAYHDGQYQALMTTVAESSRVSETTLIPALQDQCQAADSSTFGQPSAPTSIPPPAPVSSSP